MSLSRYSRQSSLREIGVEGQKKLSASKVAVVGLGALGSVSAELLARAGIGHLKLIDRDFLELNNLQRQVMYDEEDLKLNLPKAVAALAKLKKINSEISIQAEVADLNGSTIEELLGDAHLIIDGTDNFETRFLINDFSLFKKIPWVYGGAVGVEGMTYVVLPGERPCLRCVFREMPRPEEVQTCDLMGILAPVSHIVASLQVMEAMKFLAGKKEAVDKKLRTINLWTRESRGISVEDLRNNPCEGCAKQDYPYLRTQQGTKAVSLCGRNAVQIVNYSHDKLDFKQLFEKLHGVMKVEYNQYLLKCEWGDFEMTVFPNGRAIIKGTEDLGQAKSIYAKYVGA
ncbi:MAG: thiazole biosynthesis adenylyltransferase ThiF [Candidatus Omnitrophica bacterium]|nr:thiazole biosynthesis adenylyltransferase ThiF [Candidatus Omnitrophota bacterium]